MRVRWVRISALAALRASSALNALSRQVPSCCHLLLLWGVQVLPEPGQ